MRARLFSMFFGTWFIYLAFLSTGIYSIDGYSMLAVADSLVTHHNVDVPAGSGIPGKDGLIYSSWYPLQSFLAVPVVAVALKASSALHVPAHYVESLSVTVLPALYTALTVPVVYLLALSLGSADLGAWLAAITYGFSTIALAYTRDFYADPLLALLVTIGLLLAFTRGASWMILPVTALAVLAKPTGIILGPILSAYLLWKTRHFWSSLLPGIGSAVGLALYFLYNSYRFGNFRTFGPPWAFSIRFVPQGLGEMLISPGEGLVWFCPCVILSVIAFSQIKARRLEAWTIVTTATAYLILHTFYPTLGLGGWSWGPRHLLPILPGLVALTGVLRNGWRKVLVLSAILGFLLSAPNLVSYCARYYAEANEQGVSNADLMWQPSRSPLLHQWPAAYRQIQDARHNDVRQLLAQRTDIPAAKISTSRALRIVAVWWWLLPVVGVSRVWGVLASTLLAFSGIWLLILPRFQIGLISSGANLDGGSTSQSELKGSKRAMSRRTALAFLLGLSALYCIAELVPGRFVVTDEVFFKAAGRNWAATGRFAAPELKGYIGNALPTPASEVFFSYTPLYPFLFGVYTKAVGFGPRQCMLYDVVIHLLLIWCGALVARLVFGVPRGVSVLCGALLLTLGTAGRPDELGIVFAMCAALALRTEVPLKLGIPIGGVLLGLCCATSPGACLFLGSLAGCEVTLREPSYLGKLRNLAVTALIAIIVLSICVAPILVAHPMAYRQLVTSGASQTVLGNANSGGYHNSGKNFIRLWIEALRYGYDKAFLIAGCLMFAALCWLFDRKRGSTVYSRFVLVVFSLLLLMVSMPGKYFYLWFSGAWLLIACVALGWRVSRALPPIRRNTLFALGVLVWLIASIPFFRWKAIYWTLPADQSLTFNMNRVRDEVPAGAGVLTTEYWWALAGRNPVYDTLFSDPGTDSFDYVALAGNGSGRPDTPQPPAVAIVESQWQNTSDHLRSNSPGLFGFRLSRSAYGFGPYILKKID